MAGAIVIGGAKGLGRAFAVSLAEQGYDVAVTYLNSRDEAGETGRLVQEKGRKTIAIKGDVRDEEVCKKIIQSAIEEFGKIDVLVCNVGDFIYKPITQASGEELRNILETNALSAFYCIQAILPHMRENKFGRIITMGSSSSSTPLSRKLTSPYYAAKTGLYIMMRAFAAEEAKNGITVNMISPGIVKTSIVKAGVVPIGRFAEYEDITNALKFLIAEKSEYITGANIDVNGGFIPGYE